MPAITTPALREAFINVVVSSPRPEAVPAHIIPAAAVHDEIASTVEAAPYGWVSRLMKACGYTETLNAGTVVTGSGSTTTVVDVTSAADIAAGSVVRINGQCRLVTAVNTAATPDNITITPALSGIPSAADVVYASASYVSTGPNPAASFSFVVAGDGHNYVATGCNGVVALAQVDARGRVMLGFTFSVDSWSRDVSGFTSTFPTLTMPTTLLGLGSPIHWGSATSRPAASFAFDPKRTIAAQATTEGSNGRNAWVYTDEAAEATFTAYRASSTNDALQTDFETPTSRTLVAQLGGNSTTAYNFVVAAQVTQITAYPAEGDTGGIVSLPITLGVKAPTTTTLPLYALALV